MYLVEPVVESVARSNTGVVSLSVIVNDVALSYVLANAVLVVLSFSTLIVGANVTNSSSDNVIFLLSS